MRVAHEAPRVHHAARWRGGDVAARDARAQQRVAKPVRIGVLANEWWPPVESLREGLRQRGYVEGENLHFEYRWAKDRNERHPIMAADLVALPVDVIVTWGTPAALAAKRATSTIPIVMGAIGDPVRVGVVTNLARPGGNITGFSALTFEMEEKRLELLKELLSGRLSRVAVFTTTNPALPLTLEYMQRAADTFGVTLQRLLIREAKDFDEAFGAIRRDRPDAAMVLADPFLGGHQARIAAFMAEIGLPAISGLRHPSFDVRFTPESGHQAARPKCPLSAKSGHSETPFDHLVGEQSHRLATRWQTLWRLLRPPR